jgi:hypothetical protein
MHEQLLFGFSQHPLNQLWVSDNVMLYTVSTYLILVLDYCFEIVVQNIFVSFVSRLAEVPHLLSTTPFLVKRFVLMT